MPRVRIRLEGAPPTDAVLLKVADGTPWADVLAAARARLSLPPGGALSLRSPALSNAKVTHADDLEDGDELVASLEDGSAAAAAAAAAAEPAAPQAAVPAAPAPTSPPETQPSEAASKRSAKRARQKAARAAARAAGEADSDGDGADAESQPVVVLDAANIGHHADDGLRDFSWARVAAAVDYYAARGVRAVPVTKSGTLAANPVERSLCVALPCGARTPLAALVERNMVACDPDRDPEADDVAVVAFARESGAPYVTNDGYVSALRAGAPELRRWLQASQSAMHIKFAFVDGRFLPLKEHPALVAAERERMARDEARIKAAAGFGSAQEAQQRARVNAAALPPARPPPRPRSVPLLQHVSMRVRSMGPAAPGGGPPLRPAVGFVVPLELLSQGTVLQLKALVLSAAFGRAEATSGEVARLILFGADGHPFADDAAPLALALSGAGTPDAPPCDAGGGECLFALSLPADGPPPCATSAAEVTAACFGTAAYGAGGAGGGPKQEQSAVCALAASLYVCARALERRPAARDLLLANASAAGLWPPALVALRLLLCRSRWPLHPFHGAALLAGFTALAAAQPRDFFAPAEQPSPSMLVSAAPALLSALLGRFSFEGALPPVAADEDLEEDDADDETRRAGFLRRLHLVDQLTDLPLRGAAASVCAVFERDSEGEEQEEIVLVSRCDLSPEDAEAAFDDAEAHAATRALARAGPAREGDAVRRDTWCYAADAAAAPDSCATLRRPAPNQRPLLRVIPPLDVSAVASCSPRLFRLTHDKSGNLAVVESRGKEQGTFALWLPMVSESAFADMQQIATELARAAESSAPAQPRGVALPRGGVAAPRTPPAKAAAPAPTGRGRVLEAVIVILDVSSSMRTTAFQPPPPASLEAGGGSKCVFMCNLHSLWDAGRGEAAFRARLLQLCSERVGIAPVSMNVHAHPETKAFRGSAHLHFATCDAAELAVLTLDGQPAGVAGRGARLRAELAAERPQAASSGRRGGAPGGPAGRDRLSLLKTALGEFAERTIALDLPHAGGLLLCGTEVTRACGLTPSFTLFWDRAGAAAAATEGDARGGATRLYDALRVAAADLAAFRDAHGSDGSGMALRVLALTDGEDTSGDEPGPALTALTGEGITLDAVFLGGGGRMNTLGAIAHATGGVSVRPASEADALTVFEREAFLSLRARGRAAWPSGAAAAAAAPSPEELKVLARRMAAAEAAARDRGASGAGRLFALPSGVHADDDASAFGVRSGGLAMSHDAPALAPGALTAALRGAARSAEAPPRALPPTAGSARERRLQQEIQHLHRATQAGLTHPDVALFVSEAEPLRTWHAVVAAPAGRGLLYDGGAWRVLVSLPEAYPAAAPTLYFVTPIAHVNVSVDGRVCHALLGASYSPAAPLWRTVTDILVGLLTAPEPADPLNKELAALCLKDAHEGAGAARYEMAIRRAVAQHAAASAAQLEAQVLAGGAAAAATMAAQQAARAGGRQRGGRPPRG